MGAGGPVLRRLGVEVDEAAELLLQPPVRAGVLTVLGRGLCVVRGGELRGCGAVQTRG